ncbi:MAG TPA: DUF5985 family protein [Tepidisphaeraceae bacterium]|nr:DUF5985 family protein [Tepidisphaeraceae bacterium]
MSDLLHYKFMLGGLVMGCFVAALFFLRFWRKTRDRLFAIFAVAFSLLGANWLGLAFTQENETNTWYYAVRLLAFVLILFAIIDKNRAGRRREA